MEISDAQQDELTSANTAQGRLAIFVPSLQGGGAERIMVSLANEISKVREVDLVLSSAEGPYIKDVSSAVRLVELPFANFRNTRVRYLGLISTVLGLCAYLRKARPRYVLSALNNANVIAVWARQLSCVPVRLTISQRNVLSNAMDRTRLHTDRFIPQAYGKADSIVAVSEGVARDLTATLGIYSEKITVIHNPIDADYVDRLADIGLAGFPADGKLVLGIGRLTRQKDFASLIRAFSVVREQCRSTLVILGEGEMRGELEQLVRELDLSSDILMPGHDENPFNWLKRADVFVLSSPSEGFPNVLLEAMMCGTPVVSTDCPGGSAEILEHGRWGRLVPVGDAARMAQAILDTFQDDSPPEVRKRAMQFNLNSIAMKYLSVIEGRVT